MSRDARSELKTVGWILSGSILLTPLLLWLFTVFVLGRDFDFQNDYLEIYQSMFSLDVDTVGTWLIILVPVFLYEVVVTVVYYCRHPERLRSVFVFPKRKGRDH